MAQFEKLTAYRLEWCGIRVRGLSEFLYLYKRAKNSKEPRLQATFKRNLCPAYPAVPRCIDRFSNLHYVKLLKHDKENLSMPLPLIAIIPALIAGGSLVPHAAGGLIVTSASGYVAGTYLTTAAISSLFATAATTLGTGALLLSGAAATIVGGAGIFGTTIGATGITGVLMSAGLISSTPVWIPVAVGGAAFGCGVGSYRLLKLKRKIEATPKGQEAQFTEKEAKIVENLARRLGKKDGRDEKA
jgi:hypothetical protein